MEDSSNIPKAGRFGKAAHSSAKSLTPVALLVYSERSGEMMEIQTRRWKELDEDERRTILLRSESDIASVRESVEGIIRDVRTNGDRALRELTKRFDKADLTDLALRVDIREFEQARRKLSLEVRDALEYAVENVRRYHRTQQTHGLSLNESRPGVYAGERASAIPSVGLYVPRGRGSFPSMLYMLAVPAGVAGVERICVATPPNPDGTTDAACLYAAELCGVDEVYRIGGAQAIAAIAYGTESIPKVAKIIGPGSRYVSAAQRIVAGDVDVGLPAGPTESIVLADATADPKRVALDLLIEAEHGSDSSALLVTNSAALAEAVSAKVGKLVGQIPEPRRGFVHDVLTGYGGILLFDELSLAVEFVNEFAPEHLQIRTADPFQTLSSVRNAAEILLGGNTPFSAANYAIGANAILPTGGKAKTCSPVSVRDFQKYSSVLFLTEEGYLSLANHVTALADYEGFYTHALAIRARAQTDPGSSGET